MKKKVDVKIKQLLIKGRQNGTEDFPKLLQKVAYFLGQNRHEKLLICRAKTVTSCLAVASFFAQNRDELLKM